MEPIDTPTSGRSRTARRGWAVAATAGVAAASLLTSVVPAGADTFIDPNDRCLPDAEAPPAPVADREEISPVHVPSVDCLFAQGISVGTDNNTFSPTDLTRRDQMASFIVRSLQFAGYELPAPSDQGFTDIEGNTHEDNIQILAQIGVAEGTTETTFSPNQFVQRDQMASFLVRAAEFAYENADLAVGEEERLPVFPDVPPTNVHSDNIQTAALVIGLTSGNENGMYRPNAPVKREQMASFLVRLVDMTIRSGTPVVP
jgi:hypothetical protein